MAHGVVGSRAWRLWRLLGADLAATAEDIEQGKGINAQHVGAQQGDDDGADADRASAKAEAATAIVTIAAAIFAAAVFHVVAFAIAFPFHGIYSCCIDDGRGFYQ